MGEYGEPWHLDIDGDEPDAFFETGGILEHEGTQPIGQFEHVEHAERAVAAVNSVVGVPDIELRSGLVADLQERVAALEAKLVRAGHVVQEKRGVIERLEAQLTAADVLAQAAHTNHYYSQSDEELEEALAAYGAARKEGK